MLDKAKLEETAMRVKDLTPEKVSELTGIKPRRLSNFVSRPESVTFVELDRIRLALKRHDEGVANPSLT